MVGVDGAAKRNSNFLAAWKPVHQLAAYAFEPGLIDAPIGMFCVEAFRFDPEFLFCVFLVSKDQVAALDQFRYHLGCSLPPFPKVLPVIEVAGYEYSHFIGNLYRFQADQGCTFADCRSDPCPVEPVCVLEYFLPVYHARLDGADRRMRTVVDYLARAGDCPGFEEIYSQTFSSCYDMTGPNSVGPQVAQASLCQVIVREPGNIVGVNSVVGE